MATETKQPVCDVCGAPATNAARDMIRHEVPTATYVEFSPVGGTKYGCDKHPAQSEQHRTQFPPPPKVQP